VEEVAARVNEIREELVFWGIHPVLDVALMPVLEEFVEPGPHRGRDCDWRAFEHAGVEAGAEREHPERDLPSGQREPHASTHVPGWQHVILVR